MAALSFAAMYVLMYAMVARFGDVYPNLNQAWMAGLMAAPMVAIELLLMGAMYPNRRANAAILVASLAALGLFFLAIREQAAIGDGEFLRSMIPHHSSAILMCGQAPIADARIKQLCEGIIESQQAEIDLMRGWLGEGS
jgi:uncharacterized protein (DUF305 family)